jgi:hypothetical protein
MLKLLRMMKKYSKCEKYLDMVIKSLFQITSFLYILSMVSTDETDVMLVIMIVLILFPKLAIPIDNDG